MQLGHLSTWALTALTHLDTQGTLFSRFVPNLFKNQEMHNGVVHRCFFVFDSILDQYKIQEICDIVVFLHPFLIVYCPNKYKTL